MKTAKKKKIKRIAKAGGRGFIEGTAGAAVGQLFGGTGEILRFAGIAHGAAHSWNKSDPRHASTFHNTHKNLGAH